MMITRHQVTVNFSNHLNRFSTQWSVPKLVIHLFQWCIHHHWNCVLSPFCWPSSSFHSFYLSHHFGFLQRTKPLHNVSESRILWAWSSGLICPMRHLLVFLAAHDILRGLLHYHSSKVSIFFLYLDSLKVQRSLPLSITGNTMACTIPIFRKQNLLIFF